MTRRILALLAVTLAVAGFARAATTAPPTASQAAGSSAVQPGIRNSPGYVPLVDPESTSVLLGRRTNAPLVSKPFTGGAVSLDDLGKRLCLLFETTPKLDSLMRLTVQEDEFRDILWREFPQSRPVTGLTWEDGWRVLYPRLLNGCNSALYQNGGRSFQFVRFEVDSIAKYKNFKLYSGVRLVVKDEAGHEERQVWLRGIAERKGRFKIYSAED